MLNDLGKPKKEKREKRKKKQTMTGQTLAVPLGLVSADAAFRPGWCHAEKCGRANVLPSDWPESCWDGRLDGGPGPMGRDPQLMDEHVGEERGVRKEWWCTQRWAASWGAGG